MSRVRDAVREVLRGQTARAAVQALLEAGKDSEAEDRKKSRRRKIRRAGVALLGTAAVAAGYGKYLQGQVRKGERTFKQHLGTFEPGLRKKVFGESSNSTRMELVRISAQNPHAAAMLLRGTATAGAHLAKTASKEYRKIPKAKRARFWRHVRKGAVLTLGAAATGAGLYRGHKALQSMAQKKGWNQALGKVKKHQGGKGGREYGGVLQGVFREDKKYPEAPGLAKQDMALSVHKGYIHDKSGKKHELTDRQRRFFFAKMKGKYRKYLRKAQEGLNEVRAATTLSPDDITTAVKTGYVKRYDSQKRRVVRQRLHPAQRAYYRQMDRGRISTIESKQIGPRRPGSQQLRDAIRTNIDLAFGNESSRERARALTDRIWAKQLTPNQVTRALQDPDKYVRTEVVKALLKSGQHYNANQLVSLFDARSDVDYDVLDTVASFVRQRFSELNPPMRGKLHRLLVNGPLSTGLSNDMKHKLIDACNGVSRPDPRDEPSSAGPSLRLRLEPPGR